MPSPDSVQAVEYALPPFEQSLKTFSCECQSCQLCEKTRFLLPRLFFCGFLFPLCWLLSITLFGYTCCVVRGGVKFPQLDADELPTFYELEFSRTCVATPKELKKSKAVETIFGREHQSNSKSKSRSFTANQSDFIAIAKLEYLRSVSNDVLTSHNEIYRYHRNWALRTSLALAAYPLFAIFAVWISKK
ncbi:LADA_0E04192g1_1 [Lachancea dasiensis]|uniref:LADA_0E04192g1_1 n=1 Tax=Lachancea dasiensis TaxID=1072105 RepID=A0A1G4JC70_9SACH|nr:LADA_0E04192g1_1 [Lachancea dasiensis]